jgi:hypothetical protein
MTGQKQEQESQPTQSQQFHLIVPVSGEKVSRSTVELSACAAICSEVPLALGFVAVIAPAEVVET